jgi:hypothetical protein
VGRETGDQKPKDKGLLSRLQENQTLGFKDILVNEKLIRYRDKLDMEVKRGNGQI